MIIRTLAYVCDECGKNGVISSKIQDLLNLPDGWIAEEPNKYYETNKSEKHICNKCLEKRQTKETFK